MVIKTGELKVTNLGETYTNEAIYTMIEIVEGDLSMLATGQQGRSPINLSWNLDYNYETDEGLAALFYSYGTTVYEWISPMTEIPSA